MSSNDDKASKPKEDIIKLKDIEEDQKLSKGPDPTVEVEQTVKPTEEEPTAPVSGIFKEVRDLIIKVSQDHMNEIVEELKRDILRLEFIDEKGKMQIDRRPYKPMTIGMNKKVVKVGKLLRLLEADIEGMGKDGALDYEQLQKKYPSIFEDIPDAYDLQEGFGEIRANYIVGQKANIYWGIDDIDNYSLHDLMIVESLYESRNNFAPSLPSSEIQKQ